MKGNKMIKLEEVKKIYEENTKLEYSEAYEKVVKKYETFIDNSLKEKATAGNNVCKISFSITKSENFFALMKLLPEYINIGYKVTFDEFIFCGHNSKYDYSKHFEEYFKNMASLKHSQVSIQKLYMLTFIAQEMMRTEQKNAREINQLYMHEECFRRWMSDHIKLYASGYGHFDKDIETVASFPAFNYLLQKEDIVLEKVNVSISF